MHMFSSACQLSYILLTKTSSCHIKSKHFYSHLILRVICVALPLCLKGWEPVFLIRALGLSKDLSTKVGFAFSDKGLKSQDLRFRTKTIFALFDNVS